MNFNEVLSDNLRILGGQDENGIPTESLRMASSSSPLAEKFGTIEPEYHGAGEAAADAFRSTAVGMLRGFNRSLGRDSAAAYYDYVQKSNPQWAMGNKASLAGWLTYNGVSAITESAPSIAAMALVPASAPAWLSLMAGRTISFSRLYGDKYHEIMEATGGMANPYEVVGMATLNAGLQAVVEVGVGPQKWMSDAVRGATVRALRLGVQGGKGVTRRELARYGSSLVRGIMPRVPKLIAGSVEEGIEEVLQLGSDDVTLRIMAGKPFSDAADYLQNFAAGAWGGAILGGATTIIDSMARSDAEKKASLYRQKPTAEVEADAAAPNLGVGKTHPEYSARLAAFKQEQGVAFEAMQQALPEHLKPAATIIWNQAWHFAAIDAKEGGTMTPMDYVRQLSVAFVGTNQLSDQEREAFDRDVKESSRKASSAILEAGGTMHEAIKAGDDAYMAAIEEYFPGVARSVKSIDKLLHLRELRSSGAMFEQSIVSQKDRVQASDLDGYRKNLGIMVQRLAALTKEVSGTTTIPRDVIMDLLGTADLPISVVRSLVVNQDLASGVSYGGKVYSLRMNGDWSLSLIEETEAQAKAKEKRREAGASMIAAIESYGKDPKAHATALDTEIAAEKRRLRELADQRDLLEQIDAMDGRLTDEEISYNKMAKARAKSAAERIRAQMAALKAKPAPQTQAEQAQRAQQIKSFEEMAAELDKRIVAKPTVRTARQEQAAQREQQMAEEDQAALNYGLDMQVQGGVILDELTKEQLEAEAIALGIRTEGLSESQLRGLLRRRARNNGGVLMSSKKNKLFAAYLRSSNLMVLYGNAEIEDVVHEWFHHISTSGLLPESIEATLKKYYSVDAKGMSLDEIKAGYRERGETPPADEEILKGMKYTLVSEERAVRDFLSHLRDNKPTDPEILAAWEIMRETMADVYERVTGEYGPGTVMESEKVPKVTDEKGKPLNRLGQMLGITSEPVSDEAAGKVMERSEIAREIGRGAFQIIKNRKAFEVADKDIDVEALAAKLFGVKPMVKEEAPAPLESKRMAIVATETMFAQQAEEVRNYYKSFVEASPDVVRSVTQRAANKAQSILSSVLGSEAMKNVLFTDGFWAEEGKLSFNPSALASMPAMDVALKSADMFGEAWYQNGEVAIDLNGGPDSTFSIIRKDGKQMSRDQLQQVFLALHKLDPGTFFGGSVLPEIAGEMPQTILVGVSGRDAAWAKEWNEANKAALEQISKDVGFPLHIRVDSATLAFRNNGEHYDYLRVWKQRQSASSDQDGRARDPIWRLSEALDESIREEGLKVGLAPVESRRSKVTPEQDAEYLAAVEAGDTAKAQALVDEAAKKAGYTIKAWHGTGDVMRSGAVVNGQDFTVFKPSRMGALGPGIYLALDQQNAESYANRFHNPRVISAYVKLNKPFTGTTVAKTGDAMFKQFPGQTDDETIVSMRAAGYDGVLAKQPQTTKWGVVAPEMNVFDPTNIKSADPVTRDDQGNVIPLSRRFNPESPSILESNREARTPRQQNWAQLHAIFASDNGKVGHDKASAFVKDYVASKGRTIGSMADATDEELAGAAKAASEKFGRVSASDEWVRNITGGQFATLREFKAAQPVWAARELDKLEYEFQESRAGKNVKNMAAEASAAAALQRDLHKLRPMRDNVAGGPGVLQNLYNSAKQGFNRLVSKTHGLPYMTRFLDDNNEEVMARPESFTQMVWHRIRDANNRIAAKLLPVENQYASKVQDGTFHKNSNEVYTLQNGDRLTWNEMLVIYSMAQGKENLTLEDMETRREVVDKETKAKRTVKTLKPEFRGLAAWAYGNEAIQEENLDAGLIRAIDKANQIVSLIHSDATLRAQARAEIEWQNTVGKEAFEAAAAKYKARTGVEATPIRGLYTPLVRLSGDVHEADIMSIFEQLDGQSFNFDSLDSLREFRRRLGGRGGQISLDYRGNFLRHIEALNNYLEKVDVVAESLAMFGANDGELEFAIRERFGGDDEILNNFKKLIEIELKPNGRAIDPSQDPHRGILNKIQSNVYASVFPFNIFTLPTQLVSISNGLAEVGMSPGAAKATAISLSRLATHVLKNIGRVRSGELSTVLDGLDMYEEAKKYSPALLRRFPIAEVSGMKNRQNFLSKHVPGWKKMIDEGNLFMEIGDMGAVLPTWKTVFDIEQAKLAESHPEWGIETIKQKAANAAYDAVSRSQNPSTQSEKSLWQRGSAMERAIIPFSGQSFVLFQNLVNDTVIPVIQAIQDNKGAGVPVAVAKALLNKRVIMKNLGRFIIPAVLMGMVARRRPQENIEEIIKDLAVYPFTSIPVVGSMIWASMFMGWKNGGTPIAFYEELAGEAVGYVRKLAMPGSEDWFDMEDAKAAARTAGLALGVPQAFIRVLNTAVDRAASRDKTFDWQAVRESMGLKPKG